nr:ATP-dependent DNA helicase RecG [Derxia gummosa]
MADTAPGSVGRARAGKRGKSAATSAAHPSPTDTLGRRLERMGLRTARDFVLHLPLRYEDETRVTPIDELEPMLVQQVEVKVLAVEVALRGRKQLLVRAEDDTGEILLRFLNFYPNQVAAFNAAERDGKPMRVRGEVRHGWLPGAPPEMVHPKFRLVAEGAPLPKALTPVYPAAAGVSQVVLRKRIEAALKAFRLDEVLPPRLLERLGYLPLADAVHTLHHPPVRDNAALLDKSHPAWTRIKFEELLAQQLAMARARALRLARRARPMPAGGDGVRALRGALPFALTEAQERVVAEISADLAQARPMTRLLQGDVGAGKTIVAAFAAMQAIDAGLQVALMAPTEILAEQHLRKLGPLLAPIGVKTVWLAGSQKASERRAALEALLSGEAQLAVGTHALIEDTARFRALGLAIVDEQHRFGVGQRLALLRKADPEAAARAEADAAGDVTAGAGAAGKPGAAARRAAAAEPALEVHQLMMSATPIPRTLAMTALADLDVSTIDQLPPGRTPVRTRLVDNHRRDEVIDRVRHVVAGGAQCYWVCPLIEESEALQLQTAIDTHARLVEELAGLSVGLVHGKLAAAEKQAVMTAFAAGEVQVLVATTVIEVGVDVPNASLMVIEHAERFGLAQLHQLRGRVGRGAVESTCVLMYEKPLSPVAAERLRTMHETTDGFEIARRDLRIRGPGEFLGARQSGSALLRFADVELDAEIVERAQLAARWLEGHAPEAAAAHLDRWLGSREAFLKV